MPHALIFDLDGTLAESKSPMTAEMGAVLARLMLAMPVAVMSGGSYAQFQKQMLGGMPANADLKNLYLFPTSAAQCYTWKDGSWQLLYSNPFTPEEKSLVLRALSESLHETGLDVPPPQLWGEQTEDRGAQITWSALGQEAPIAEKKAWDPDRKKREPLQAALLARLPGFSVRVNATNSIDITRAGMTKAYGVRKFSEMLGLPIPDMLYVGDALFPGGNDEIVKEAGVPTRQVTGPAETARAIEEILSGA
ncbi:MAG TPA: HAD-IIB family hydrolase [Candidatus Paceibacterota bacterium]|nr:HAD-IIB family hydrolase [Candidatus Paceibacterota bacterium]